MIGSRILLAFLLFATFATHAADKPGLFGRLRAKLSSQAGPATPPTYDHVGTMSPDDALAAQSVGLIPEALNQRYAEISSQMLTYPDWQKRDRLVAEALGLWLERLVNHPANVDVAEVRIYANYTSQDPSLMVRTLRQRVWAILGLTDAALRAVAPGYSANGDLGISRTLAPRPRYSPIDFSILPEVEAAPLPYLNLEPALSSLLGLLARIEAAPDQPVIEHLRETLRTLAKELAEVRDTVEGREDQAALTDKPSVIPNSSERDDEAAALSLGQTVESWQAWIAQAIEGDTSPRRDTRLAIAAGVPLLKHVLADTPDAKTMLRHKFYRTFTLAHVDELNLALRKAALSQLGLVEMAHEQGQNYRWARLVTFTGSNPTDAHLARVLTAIDRIQRFERTLIPRAVDVVLTRIAEEIDPYQRVTLPKGPGPGAPPRANEVSIDWRKQAQAAYVRADEMIVARLLKVDDEILNSAVADLVHSNALTTAPFVQAGFKHLPHDLRHFETYKIENELKNALDPNAIFSAQSTVLGGETSYRVESRIEHVRHLILNHMTQDCALRLTSASRQREALRETREAEAQVRRNLEEAEAIRKMKASGQVVYAGSVEVAKKKR